MQLFIILLLVFQSVFSAEKAYKVYLADGIITVNSLDFKKLQEHSTVVHSQTDGAVIARAELRLPDIATLTFEQILCYCMQEKYIIQVPCGRNNRLFSPAPLAQAALKLEITGLVDECIIQLASMINDQQKLKNLSRDLIRDNPPPKHSFYAQFLGTNTEIHQKIVFKLWHQEWREKVEIPKMMGLQPKKNIFYEDLEHYILSKSHKYLSGHEHELAVDLLKKKYPAYKVTHKAKQ